MRTIAAISQSMQSRYKLVLLGDSFVGKSSIVAHFVHNTFQENVESTIGAAFLVKSMVINGKKILFEIWDTAGQERYRALTPMYYRGAKAAIVVYDVTNKTSFDHAKQWIGDLRKEASPNIVVCLVGNKIDLENREVSRSEGEEYSSQENIMFLESSAKTGFQIDAIFHEILAHFPTDEIETPGIETELPIRLHDGEDKKRIERCC